MIADVELMETVARLIDPDAWRRMDQCREEHPDFDEWLPSRFTIESRDAALRVIDGLGLELSQLTGVIIGMMPEKKEEE